MADIELVIKMPREKYNVIKSDLYNTFPAEMKEWGLEAIRNGTPIPDSIKVYCVMNGEARTNLANVVYATTNENDAERFSHDHTFTDYDGNPYIEVLDVAKNEVEE